MQLALSKTIQNTKILLLSWRTNYAIIKSDQTSQMAAVNGLRINPITTRITPSFPMRNYLTNLFLSLAQNKYLKNIVKGKW